jgi:hypothetical protein
MSTMRNVKKDPARELLEAHACDQGIELNELARQRALYLIETEGLLDDLQPASAAAR